MQRYPVEWAESLRAMVAVEPELFVPAHGLPIAGRERIRTCLETVASTLETLVADVIEAMNAGAFLDEIVQTVRVPAATLELPYLRPLYDEPEFVIRNIWRMFGGWWDGNPARLKPPSDAVLGAEVARLAGGVDRLVDRATELAGAGEHRLACQVIEYAAAAEPDSHAVHEARSTIYADATCRGDVADGQGHLQVGPGRLRLRGHGRGRRGEHGVGDRRRMSDYADLVERIEAIAEEIDDRAFGELTEAVAARDRRPSRIGQTADAGAAGAGEGGRRHCARSTPRRPTTDR